MTTMINIDELHKEHDQKEEQRLNVYDQILEKVHQKIKMTNSLSKDKFCFYSVPTYVYGLPLFNTNNCIIYLTQKLTDNGFYVRYTDPNLLLISWMQKPKKNTVSYKSIQDSKRKALGYRSIEDYKPSNQFVYDPNSLSSLEKKANELLFNDKFL
jgi:hypothetical protein